MLNLPILAMVLLGVTRTVATAEAEPQGAQRASPYFGGCDYSPIGKNAPSYNCDWLGNGGKDACTALVPNCVTPCFRAGSNDNKVGFTIVTENDGNSICRCRCKLN